MHQGTLESDFIRSIGVLISVGAILFAVQGLIFPPVSLVFGYEILFGLDLFYLFYIAGGGIGTAALIGIRFKSLTLERASFATMCWFYIMLLVVIIWLIGLQAPSALFALVMSLVTGSIYACITQRGKNAKDSYGRAVRQSKIRESIPSDNSNARLDEG